MGGEKKTDVRIDSTLSKGLLILESLAGSSEDRGVTELSRELNLTKSNTFRLLRSLSELGYVRATPDRKYQATTKIWQVGLKVIENLDICEIATPQMRLLSQLTGEAIYLAIPNDLSIIYIDKIDSTQPIRSFTPKGGTAPIHCVGTGKALLCSNYEKLREVIKDKLDRYTDKTITTIEKMDKDMAETRRRGYAIDRGEYRERIMSFGASIYLPNGEAIAAIGVSAPEVNLSKGRINKICSSVLTAANAVSVALEYDSLD